MTAQPRTFRETGRQLRVLEEAIAAQRRAIASLEACNLDAESARAHLTQLLRLLDQVLAQATNGAMPVSEQEDARHATLAISRWP